MIALGVLSLGAWTIMIGKYLDLMRLRRLNGVFERELNRVGSVVDVDTRSGRVSRGGPFARLMVEGVNACRRYSAGGGKVDVGRMSACMGHVENALQRTVAACSMDYESRMVLLGSIVTGAPFMGLLGAVWGVMDAFGSVSFQSGVSLQSLAPGVSGALLTTVAGLLVAIPSVFGYNFLLTQTKLMVVELENFASTLADRIELELRAGL